VVVEAGVVVVVAFTVVVVAAVVVVVVSGIVVVVVVVSGTVVVVVVVVVVVDGGGGGGATVVDVVVAMLVEVVVVLVTEGQSSGPGSSWPTSKAIATERPWASTKNWPMMTGWGSALIDTEIGFCPDWSTSSTPGVPTNLHTNTLSLGSDVVVVASCPVANGVAQPASTTRVRMMVGDRRIGGD
jgi:hypothetical protein